MSRASIVALAPIVLLAACGSSVDPEAALEAVHATEQAQLQAIAGKDLRGAVRNYEDDAILVTPGKAPASGGEAIAAAFDELLADPELKIELTPGAAWVSEGGDLAVTTATLIYTSTEGVSVVSNQTVWRKPTGKPWRIASDYNVALPDAEPQVAANE